MPDQRYDAARQTIGSLLSTTSPRIEVPEWQRSYSWDAAQIETFWQDLSTFSAQYLNSNIVGEEYFLGSIVLVIGGPTNQVLDGQQRLATATILLSVLRDARQQHKADSATRLQNKYIADFDDQSSTTTHVLTMNRYDRDFFRAEIQDVPANPPNRPQPILRSHGLIRRAREYFAARIAEESTALGGGDAAFQWNLRIGKVLCDHLSVVAVTSTDEDNAAAVFETLNDRGIGLSTPDLLRNFLLRRADDATARDRVAAAWQTILSIDEEASVDEFLRHYWISNRGDVKARKLYREIKNRILEEGIDSLDMSLDLAESAPLYRDIVHAREDDAELQRLLAGIRALGAKALYPLLLSAYAVTENGDRERLRDLARALTTLFVRYNVIGGRETTVMERTIYKAAAQLRQDKSFDTAIASLADLAPDPVEFGSRFSRASVNRTATVRYLLREIEHAKRRTEEVAIEGTDRVHVEHIYPQTPSGTRWDNHSMMINRLGNVTLLGKRLNTSIKNAGFDAKKDDAYSESDVLMTRELTGRTIWDEAAINERQMELSKWAVDIWKFPGEAISPSLGGIKEATDDMDEPTESPEQLPEVPSG